MARSPLSDAESDARLAGLPGWTRDGHRLKRTYRFEKFAGAIAFVNRAAEIAERLDHHPDILVEYTAVTLSCTTHDAGGLTAGDFALAAAIDA